MQQREVMPMSTQEALIFEKLKTEVPNPKQQEFFRATARNIGYGGSRGGG